MHFETHSEAHKQPYCNIALNFGNELKFKSTQMPFFTICIGDKSGCLKSYFFDFVKVELQNIIKHLIIQIMHNI